MGAAFLHASTALVDNRPSSARFLASAAAGFFAIVLILFVQASVKKESVTSRLI